MGESQISFEHAVFLLGALLAGDELRVAHCRDCSGVLVTDRLALRIPVCNECSASRSATAKPRLARARYRRVGAGRRVRRGCGRFARVTIRPTLFAGPFLERRAELRDDPAWIAAARGDPATRYLLSAGATQLVTGERAAEIAFLDGGHSLVAAARDEELTLLGWFRGTRCVLVELRDPGAAAARGHRTCASCGRWRPCCRPTPPRCSPTRARWRCGRPGTGIAACAAPPIFRRAPAMSCAAAGRLRHRVFSAARPGDHRAGHRRHRRTRLVRPAGIVGGGPLFDHRRIRRARRKSRRRGDARSRGRNRRAGRRRRVRRLTTLAIPVVADAGIPRGGAHPRHHAARRRARRRALVHACRSRRGPSRAAAGGRDLRAAHRCAGSARRPGRPAAGSRRCVC